METIALKYKQLSIDDNFYDFCVQNDQHKVERDSDGTIYIIPKFRRYHGNVESDHYLLVDALAPCHQYGPCF